MKVERIKGRQEGQKEGRRTEELYRTWRTFKLKFKLNLLNNVFHTKQ